MEITLGAIRADDPCSQVSQLSVRLVKTMRGKSGLAKRWFSRSMAECDGGLADIKLSEGFQATGADESASRGNKATPAGMP